MADPITTIQTASNTVNALSVFLDALTNFVPKAVMACAILAAMTPPPDPKSKFYPILSVLDRIVNFIGANFGHAKNQRGDKST